MNKEKDKEKKVITLKIQIESPDKIMRMNKTFWCEKTSRSVTLILCEISKILQRIGRPVFSEVREKKL